MPERYLGRVLGRYRVDAFVGSGGFAWVYRGFDPDLEITVALKVLKPQFAGDPEFEARFRREASTAAKLRHPNIVTIYAVGREDDAVYFAMDFLAQGLTARLDVTPTLPEAVVTRLGADVARGLGFAHRAGVVHRDVKVDNILFDDHGNAIVVDFGIARAAAEAAQETRTNVVVGTPQYFAPEQARGMPVDGRTDVYALGVTLFRSATGRLPFEGEDWYVIAKQHVEVDAPSLRALNPAISPGFEAVVLRCLAKDPDDRYATAEELADALNRCAGQPMDASSAPTMAVPALDLPGPVRVGIPTETSQTGQAPNRWRRPALIAGGAAGVATIAAVLAMQGGGDVSGGTPVPEPGPLRIDTLAALVVLPPAPGDSAELEQPSAAARLGSLRVVARGARIEVNGRAVGSNSWSSDTLAPGRYTVSARVPDAIDGCDAAETAQTITLGAAGARTVTLEPRACGRISFSRAPAGTTYRFVMRGGRRTVFDGAVPLNRPIVLPAGRYDLTLSRPGCEGEYEEEVEITAATEGAPPQRNSAIPLCTG